jgi:hypothetical protein
MILCRYILFQRQDFVLVLAQIPPATFHPVVEAGVGLLIPLRDHSKVPSVQQSEAALVVTLIEERSKLNQSNQSHAPVQIEDHKDTKHSNDAEWELLPDYKDEDDKLPIGNNRFVVDDDVPKTTCACKNINTCVLCYVASLNLV